MRRQTLHYHRFAPFPVAVIRAITEFFRLTEKAQRESISRETINF